MKKNTFIEGTMIATISIILVKLLGMLYVIPFYKIVGSQGGALYSYAYNIYLLFLNISSAGLPNAISKIISEYDTLGYADTKKRSFNIAKKIIMFVSIITFLVLFVFAEEIGMLIIGDLKGGNTYQDVAFVVRCVAPAVLVVPFLSITKGFLQGHKIVAPSSYSQIIEQVTRIMIILCGSYLVLNVFNGTLSLAVGVATASAGISAFVAYLYVRSQFKKAALLDENVAKKQEEEKITNKMLTRKIISYAVPFIIISIITDIYNFTDQLLVLRTISKMGYSTEDVEFIASAIATWSPKICMTINALAMGMSVPLIPTIVSAFTKKDKIELNDKINKSIALVFYLSLPIAFGIASLAQPVWRLFYNSNPYGGMILNLAVISALCANVYMIISIILQSLNQYKLVYKVAVAGFLLNALFDIPWMMLMHHIGLEGFIGSINNNKPLSKAIFHPDLIQKYEDNHLSCLEAISDNITETDYNLSDKLSKQQLQNIFRDIYYAKAFIRNKLNHASEEESTTEEMNEYFKINGYPVDNELNVRTIREFLSNAIQKLEL